MGMAGKVSELVCMVAYGGFSVVGMVTFIVGVLYYYSIATATPRKKRVCAPTSPLSYVAAFRRPCPHSCLPPFSHPALTEPRPRPPARLPPPTFSLFYRSIARTCCFVCLRPYCQPCMTPPVRMA
jgi:hypothetical protein